MIYRAVVALLAVLVLSAASPAKPDYAAGQVWEYHTRDGDEGSLVKIQKIEQLGAAEKAYTVYHVSVIGVHFRGVAFDGTLAHLPVSRETLDASVTRLSASTAAFPDATPGIAEWRAAKGGVFTIPLAKIVTFVEQSIGQHG